MNELVEYLQSLSEPELRAYCLGVRSGAQSQALEVLAALDVYLDKLDRLCARPGAEIIDLVRRCDRCDLPLEGDRRRRRHIVCPVDTDRPGAVLAMEPRRAAVGRRAA